MKLRSGSVVGAVAFLTWEILCGFVRFDARDYTARSVDVSQ
jgi:hypothetical protein